MTLNTLVARQKQAVNCARAHVHMWLGSPKGLKPAMLRATCEDPDYTARVTLRLADEVYNFDVHLMTGEVTMERPHRAAALLMEMEALS